MTDPLEVGPDRVIDSDNVLIEPHRLEEAESFVREEALLDGLDADERSEIVEHIARMLTTADIAVFDAEEGLINTTTLDFVADGERKTIIVFGTRTIEGVMCEVILLNTEEADRVFEEE
jgi:hypothetical protein